MGIPFKQNFGCRFVKGISLLSLAVVSIFPLSRAAASQGKSSWSIGWQPVKVVNGAPMVLRVKAPVRLSSLSGSWLGHEVFFAFDPSSKAWYGIAGVSLTTRPGAYPLQLKGTSAAGKEMAFERKIAVGKAKYPVISVTVAKRFTEPNTQELKEIHQEKTLKQDLFRHLEPEREWSGPFLPPVKARISDVFGTRRVFNGETRSVHEGLDYAVPPGTPVSALNSGTVLLAQPLYFEGNCIVLDHGQGLMTLYLHLSKFEVKEGEQVTRGQEIGRSGGTGRATGPHLHIAVRWQGVYLNPATLLKLQLPRHDSAAKP